MAITDGLRESIIEGAPQDADPSIVEKYADEVVVAIMRAERNGLPVGPVIRKVARHFPQLHQHNAETPRELHERLTGRGERSTSPAVDSAESAV